MLALVSVRRMLAVLCLAAAVLLPVRTPDPRRFTQNRLPVTFEANRGQAPGDAQFLVRGRDSVLLLKSGETVLEVAGVSVSTHLEGSRPSIAPEALEPLAARSNYFFGNDPARWLTDVPHFARVRYDEVYPGIDLVYHGSGRQLEYDFQVAPGADPSAIRIRFEGASQVRLTDAGDLALTAGTAEILQHKPVAYQETPQGVRTVAANYRLAGNRVEFALGEYDAAYPVVIDPVVTFATLYGGNGDDIATSVAVDSSGNAYMTGGAFASNLRLQSPLQQYAGGGDAYLIKVSPSGDTLLYATYFGGGGNDLVRSVAVDGAGNVYMAGETTSPDFPLRNPIQGTVRGRDAFVAKINSAGNALVYSTFYGGAGADAAYGIALDSAGNAYFGGSTTSTNLETVNPLQAQSGGGTDAFVAKINAAGSAFTYATYLGGAGGEFVFSVAVDAAGNAYVAGNTGSTAFPPVNAFQPTRGGGVDGFVSKLNPTGNALIYSTYLGGNDNEQVNGIAIAANGSAVVTGVTRSTDFPRVRAVQGTFRGVDDGFVTRLSPSGSTLEFSTYLGGTGTDVGIGVALDSNGNAYIVGFTDSPDFPVEEILGAGQLREAFLAIYTPAGALDYTGLYGGSGGDVATSVAIDRDTTAWIAGQTDSGNLPLIRPLQATLGSPAGLNIRDAVLVKLDLAASAPPIGPLSMVSAASFVVGPVAPESIVAAYGAGLAGEISVASSATLPETLAGVQVVVLDSRDVESFAKLYFVSPGQINFVMPRGTALGTADVLVLRNGMPIAVGTIEVQAVAPALFTANSNGQGVAAALALRVTAAGEQSTSLIFQCPAPGACTATPIDLGPDTDQVFVSLFGTGLRGRSAASAVRATLNGQSAESSDAVAQPQYDGMDQVNVRLGRNLIGAGQLTLQLNIDGRNANAVTLNIGGVKPPPEPVPQISSLSPNSGARGQTITTFTVNGQNLSGVTSIDFSPATGITVSNLRTTATSVTAQVAIASNATIGTRSVTVNSSAGRSNALNFSITAPQPIPVITSLLPKAAVPGQTFSLSISGSNLTNINAVEFSPPDGITVSGISGSTANVAIAQDAAPGVRMVRVTTPAGTSNESPFTIVQADRPFSLSNLQVLSARVRTTNTPSGSEIQYSVTVDDPTGAVCREDFFVSTTIGGEEFRDTFFGFATAGALNCPGGVTPVVLQRTTSLPNDILLTGIDIPFKVRLTNSIGLRTDEIRVTFRVQQ